MFRLDLQIAFLALVGSVALEAQIEVGDAGGRVAATDGSALQGASVTLSNSVANVRLTTTTDERGEWQIRSVRVNVYQLQIGLEGFGDLVRETSVRPGETRSIVTLLTPTSLAADVLLSAESPLIAGAQNSASNWPGFTPQPGVSPGGTINIFGAAITDQPLVQATELPLTDSLGGARFWVETANGIFPTYPVFLTPNQAAVVLDSNTPVGEGHLVGEVNGALSNRWRIDVVAQQPAFYTVSQDGAGQAIVTRADFSLVTLDRPLTPGEVFIAWGNGWGRSEFDDTGGQFDKRGQYGDFKLYFGDRQLRAEDILYVGSAGGFAGGDQIIGRTPADVTLSCGAPLFGLIEPADGGEPIISNIVTAPTSPDGGPCGDRAGLSSSQISQLAQPNGSLNIADLTLDEQRFFNTGGGRSIRFFRGSAEGRRVNLGTYLPPLPDGTCVMIWRPDNFQDVRGPEPLEFTGAFTVETPFSLFDIGPNSNAAPFRHVLGIPSGVELPAGGLRMAAPFTPRVGEPQLIQMPYSRTAGQISDALNFSVVRGFLTPTQAVDVARRGSAGFVRALADGEVGFGYRAIFDAGARGVSTLECREDLRNLATTSLPTVAMKMQRALAPARVESGDAQAFIFPTDTQVDIDVLEVDVFRIHVDASQRIPFRNEHFSDTVARTCDFATCP